IDVASQIAEGLTAAHEAGMVHRDIKPANIMVTNDGVVKIVDFGLAKLAGQTKLTKTGTTVGTVAYMSPEQAEGKPIDSRSDIFSLGTILYEMTTGTRPFHGDTGISTIGAILKDEPTTVTELNVALPRHLGRIIRRCLAKDPDRRYQTALDLRNELEELKAEIDSGEHTPEIGVAADRPRRSSRLLLLLGVVAA
ncbi:MAG: serine/threonine-protein kinase, partial [Acidimicrobiales bacterium]